MPPESKRRTRCLLSPSRQVRLNGGSASRPRGRYLGESTSLRSPGKQPLPRRPLGSTPRAHTAKAVHHGGTRAGAARSRFSRSAASNTSCAWVYEIGSSVRDSRAPASRATHAACLSVRCRRSPAPPPDELCIGRLRARQEPPFASIFRASPPRPMPARAHRDGSPISYLALF